MGKRVRKSKKGFLVIELFLLVLICVSLYGGYYFYNEIKSLEKIEKKNDLDYKNINKRLKSSEKELKEVSLELDSYKDIDSKIEGIKTEYFNKIKSLEDDIISGKSNKKIAYITFDDGPHYNTYKVLSILDEKDVKATFFTISMNGEYCYDNKSARCFDLYKEYVKRGHTIANHTYTHAIRGGLYNSVDSFMDAIVRQEEHIKNQTGGYVTNITRFPGGSSTAKSLKEPIISKLKERGYGWVDWTANDGDGGGLHSQEQAWNNLRNTINSNIEVILFHDYNGITTAILPDVIDYLRENGYECYPLFYESNMINK